MICWQCLFISYNMSIKIPGKKSPFILIEEKQNGRKKFFSLLKIQNEIFRWHKLTARSDQCHLYKNIQKMRLLL